MKKENRKRKPRKELPLWLNLILVLLFLIVYFLFSISSAFLISELISHFSEADTVYALYTLLSGTIYMALLIILVRNSDSENVQPLKWYINCICISLIGNLILTGLAILAIGIERDIDINYFVGFGMIPLAGIIVTPNIIKHVKKDTAKWKNIFYRNGNLHSSKKIEDFYRVNTPVSFEKKLLLAVYKNQFLNVLAVIGIMLIVIGASVHHIIREHSYTGEVIRDLIELRTRRGFGVMFFLTVFFIAFGIPIIAYYVSNALKKIRVVKNHEYIAYHAIVSGVHNGNINIYEKNKQYSYKYCTCVGIKEKDVQHIPATLIFLPDDVFLFPDNENYKVDKQE